MVQDLEELTDHGERVLHLYPNDCFQAHLSIYRFALPYCEGADVLDAGSGNGYGSAYFADRGAKSVLGVEISEKAVGFSSAYFTQPNLTYRVADLSHPIDLPSQSFDVIYSSNVLEHIPDVPTALRTAHRLLRASGTLVIAVPPIINEASRQDNISSPHHLNIWSPEQWEHVLRQYFVSVQPYRHWLTKPGVVLNFANPPSESEVQEEDFAFAPVSLSEIRTLPTMTAIFVAHQPRSLDALPSPDASVEFIDDSFTKSPEAVPDHSPTLPPRWRRLLAASWYTLRHSGVQALLRRIRQYRERRREYKQAVRR